MDKLSKHPEVKAPQHNRAWKKINQDVSRNLDKLETLKPKIKTRRDTWLHFAARRREEREQWAKDQAKKQEDTSLEGGIEQLSLEGRRPRSSSGLFEKRRELKAGEDHGLAVKLARKGFGKRKRGFVSEGSSESEQGRQAATWRYTRVDGTEDDSDDSIDDLAKKIVEAGRRGESTFINRDGRRSPGGTTFTPASYRYPSVPQKSTHEQLGETQILQPTPSSSRVTHSKGSLQDAIPPHRPPKVVAAEEAQGPPIPQKIGGHSHIEPASRSSTATPELDSRNFNFKPSAFTEAGTPLRTVFLPPALRTRFLQIALPNTRRNLETCGILCGTLISNAFFITKLIIPEQESTSDTCDTMNEEALFDYCDSQDLLTLGWIHTHPTQTCFMSSRDLHTHSGYQVQMSESIAIVCAPQHEPSWGIFRLTDPPGLKTVLNCRQIGIFHPHGEPNVYTDALKPGHVWELPGLEFDLVDLRPGKD
jgi:STAM-binding protein